MAQLELKQYQTFIFDCDGVVLNSNKIKSKAFFEVTKHYGDKFAKKLVDYHIQNGGVSRYIKFKYFITNILQKEICQQELQDLLEKFSYEVTKGLMTCEIAKGLESLRDKTKHANWLIVSGGDQNELRDVFSHRGLNEYFDGGIFGSPDSKDLILSRELSCENIKKNSLFLGDSKYDYEVSKSYGLDFVFISGWSEVDDWVRWSQENKFGVMKALENL